jgi:hypothetical protein
MVVGISIDFSCISPPEREDLYPQITQIYTDKEAKTERRNLATKDSKTPGRDAGTLPKKRFVHRFHRAVRTKPHPLACAPTDTLFPPIREYTLQGSFVELCIVRHSAPRLSRHFGQEAQPFSFTGCGAGFLSL